ncbi:MAG: hypothetical protein J6S53_10805, partial [Lentisphaeria bacterium]|nr:hypothetical protein [Lentisphaeria bacterium]
MWKYLFSSIPEIVFEAFAVCTLIWAVFSIFLLRKRNKVLFWLFTGTVFCMILWRISLHSIMSSSRYAAILIYPAAVFSGCLSMKSKLIFRWIFRKLKLDFLCLRLICRLLPVVVFTGLMIACTAKSLRVNSQGDFIRKICRKYLRVSGGKGHVYVTANEVYRISWHIKRRNKDICCLPIRKESGFSEVCKQVTLLKNMPGDHYFFFYVRKG